MNLKSLTSVVLNAIRPVPVTYAYKRQNGSTWLTVRNAATDEPAEMVIEGSIGESWWDSSGTTSRQFRNALSAIPKQKDVLVRINSEGGSVGEALSIYNVMRDRGNVDVKVDGYALSSASIIALGGRSLSMPKSSIMMIHEPWSMTVGNEEEHKKSAEMLATHAETLAKIYAEKSGKTAEDCRALMKAETWLSGEEAEEEGFADEVGEDEEDETEAKAKVATLDLTRFQNVPQAVLNMAKPAGKPSSPGQVADGTAGDPSRPHAQNAPTQTGALNDIVMNRAQMIALLKTWGVTVDEKATDEQLRDLVAKGKPEAKPEPKKDDDNVITLPKSELDAIRASLDKERKARIESRLDQLVRDQRLTNEERPDALKRALADETYLDVIAKRPAIFQAGEPLGSGHEIEVNGNFLDRIRDTRATGQAHAIGGMDAVSAALRYEERRRNWAEMYATAKALDSRGMRPNRSIMSNPLVRFVQLSGDRMLPVNTASYATSLIVDQLADGAITQLVNTLAPLRIFARDFAPSPFAPLSTLQVRLVTSGSDTTVETPKATGTTTTTAVNYEQGDHTVSNIAVTMYEENKSFFVTSQELMSGLRIEFLANHALQTLGTEIMQKVLVKLNDQTFTGGPSSGSITAHYGNWTWNSNSSSVNDMAVLRSQLGKSAIKNCVLDPVLFSKLITVPVANQMSVGMPLSNPNTMRNIMGWDEIAETSAWATGQGAGGSTASYPQPIIGFACHPQAMVVAARLPILPPEGVPGNTLVMAQVAIPGLDLTVAIFSWFSLQYRTLWNSYGIVFGCNTGDLTAGCVVKSLGI